MNIMRQSACLVVNPITLIAMVSSLIHDGWSGFRLSFVSSYCVNLIRLFPCDDALHSLGSRHVS